MNLMKNTTASHVDTV